MLGEHKHTCQSESAGVCLVEWTHKHQLTYYGMHHNTIQWYAFQIQALKLENLKDIEVRTFGRLNTWKFEILKVWEFSIIKKIGNIQTSKLPNLHTFQRLKLLKPQTFLRPSTAQLLNFQRLASLKPCNVHCFVNVYCFVMRSLMRSSMIVLVRQAHGQAQGAPSHTN